MKYQDLVPAATLLSMLLTGTAYAGESHPHPTPEKVVDATALEAEHSAKDGTLAIRQAARSRALKDGWPDTELGITASGWIEAFSTGADVMRQFLKDHMTEKALADRPIKLRMDSYPVLREQLGNLMLAEVRESSTEELTVVLLAEDTKQHHFVFTADPEAPHKLVSVGIVQREYGHGGH